MDMLCNIICCIIVLILPIILWVYAFICCYKTKNSYSEKISKEELEELNQMLNDFILKNNKEK